MNALRRQSIRPQQTFERWPALVNIHRKALLSSVGFRKRMTSRSPRGIYLYVFGSITHSDLSDDLGCLPFDRKIRLGCQNHNGKRFASLP